MISLRAMMMRGGTSKGLYLLKSDLDQTGLEPDALLPAIMGSPDCRQIDGLGGGSSTTSKVAVVSSSSRRDCEIDYRFAQVDISTRRVDWTPTCGNLLTGIGPFVVERGLVAANDPLTAMRVHLVNTGATAIVSFHTPEGQVRYEGGWQVSGVPGRAAPIDTVFSDFCGCHTGTLFPTGNPVDLVEGIPITAIDAGVCAVIAEANEFGLVGDESPLQLNGDRELLERIESVRLRAGVVMGLGDVRGCVLPKIMLVSKADYVDVRSRYFVPGSCHPTHAVSGAICLATAATVSETLVGELIGRSFITGPMVIEHPVGTMAVEIICWGGDFGIHAAVRSTARKLFDGYVFANIDSKAS